MNTRDRMNRLLNHYNAGHTMEAHGSGYHILLNFLDRKIGLDTRGGVRHDPFCGSPHGQPVNYVGTRIRLHEEYIAPDYFPECCVEPNLPRLSESEEKMISCSHWGLFEGE